MTELLGGKVLYFHEILGTSLTGKTGGLNEKFALEGGTYRTVSKDALSFPGKIALFAG